MSLVLMSVHCQCQSDARSDWPPAKNNSMAGWLKQAATDDSKFSDRADKERHTIAQADNLCLSSMGHLQREGSQQLAPSSSRSPACNSCTIQDTVASGAASSLIQTQKPHHVMWCACCNHC